MLYHRTINAHATWRLLKGSNLSVLNNRHNINFINWGDEYMTNIHIFEDSTCLKMVYCNTGILALENE